MKTVLFIPTLNEIDGMRAVMPKISRDWVDDILVVDGGSTDGTAEYARDNGYRVITQKKKGIRYAYNEGLAEVNADVVITFSPDGNSIPELIPGLVKMMTEGYDMVIVSRYLGDARSEDDGVLTGFGNKVFTFLINKLHGGKYTDAMVIYRAWKKNVFYDLDLDKDASYAFEERMFHTVVGVEPLLSIRAAKRKLKCSEMPGSEPPRIGGKAKLQMWRWGASYLYEVFRETVSWR